MKNFRSHLAILAMLTSLVSLPSVALAEESTSKLKSETVGWILALDPIPGDALFYADKPGQGIASFLLGMPFAIPFYLLIAHAASGGDCVIGESRCEVSTTDLMLVTGIPYFATLVWDGVGGIGGVKKHNDRIRQKASLLQSLQPVVSVMPDGGYAGVQFKF